MHSNSKINSEIINVVGYGTFITKLQWINDPNVEVCTINDFIRILPRGNWFPYVLPLQKKSFKALKFSVDETHLKKLDIYEGVQANLFERVEIEIIIKNQNRINAFIYIPTKDTIKTQKLNPNIDENDSWKEEIKKFPEIIKKFPDLI